MYATSKNDICVLQFYRCTCIIGCQSWLGNYPNFCYSSIVLCFIVDRELSYYHCYYTYSAPGDRVLTVTNQFPFVKGINLYRIDVLARCCMPYNSQCSCSVCSTTGNSNCSVSADKWLARDKNVYGCSYKCLCLSAVMLVTVTTEWYYYGCYLEWTPKIQKCEFTVVLWENGNSLDKNRHLDN